MSTTPRFKIVPDESELASLERDLRFFPSHSPAPRRLQPADIEHFNAQGYVTGLTIFSPDEIAGIREYFDGLLERVTAAGGNSYSISSAHMKYGPVWDLLTEPRIVDCVADLLGDNVVGWGAHFFCKLPRDGKTVAWHQDSSYWPLTPTRAVTVWLAIDPADIENGCMKFVAGSHHSGHLTYRPSGSHEDNVLTQTIENPLQYGQEVYNPLAAGQASIHSDLLLHGSEANNSDRRRCALTLRFAAADVTAHLGWNQKGVWCRGKDARGHWANLPRPTEE